MRNSGWESALKLNRMFKDKHAFNISAEIRLARNDNKILAFSEKYGELYTLKTPGTQNWGIVARKGNNAFEYEVFDFKKDDQGRVIVDKNTGYPSVDQIKPIFSGRTMPLYTGGFSLNMTWKGFSLATVGEFNTGAMHFYGKAEDYVAGGLSTLTTYNDRRPFIFPNSSYDDGTGHYVTNTDVYTRTANQELYQNFKTSSINYLTSADFFKIKEVVIGYEHAFKTNTIKKFNISIYGKNLLNLYKKDNLYGDPQLVKGPGRYNQLLGSTPPEYVTGAGSESAYVSGIIEYGAILTLSF
jgi:hypothetical protein